MVTEYTPEGVEDDGLGGPSYCKQRVSDEVMNLVNVIGYEQTQRYLDELSLQLFGERLREVVPSWKG